MRSSRHQAYQFGVDALGLRKEEITFAAYARLGCGWRGLVRLSERVDQPAGSTGRSPRHFARRRGKRSLGLVRFYQAQASPLAPRASFAIDLI